MRTAIMVAIAAALCWIGVALTANYLSAEALRARLEQSLADDTVAASLAVERALARFALEASLHDLDNRYNLSYDIERVPTGNGSYLYTLRFMDRAAAGVTP